MMGSPSGVLLIAACLSDRGGLQQRLADLARTLSDEHEVTVLTWSPPGRGPIRLAGARVVVAPSLCSWERDHRPPLAALNTIVSGLSGVLAATRLRRRWSVALAAGLHPEATVALLAAGRARRVMVTTWLVGPLGNAARLRRSWTRRATLALLRRASGFVAETAEARSELIALGFPAERIATIVAGVDLERFAPAPDSAVPAVPHRAVYAGRFDLRQKRLDLLLEAWAQAGLENWELVLAGAGPDEGTVRRLAAPLANVLVLGWQEDVPALLSGAQCFVLPSEAETSALGMLEGMACGLPGIVSATPGLAARRPEGVLLVANDVDRWSAALRQMDALGLEGRAASGARARAWVRSRGDAQRSRTQWLELLAAR